ncbi:MAG: hypothetical protein AAFW70_02035 [Cyanobacteria bacterium J06635_10]
MFNTQFVTTPEIVCTINDFLFPVFLFCLIFGLLCYLIYDYEQHQILMEIHNKPDGICVQKMQSESGIVRPRQEEATTIVEKDEETKLLIDLGIRNLRLFCKQRKITGYSTAYKRGRIKGLAEFILSRGYFHSDIAIALK